MNGQMIILSDIAASTLGVSLFVLLVAFALQGQPDTTPMSPQIQGGEISENFKTITAAPLSSGQIVAALYARSASIGPDRLSMDLFHDRVDVVIGAGTQTTHGVARTDPAFRAQLEQMLMRDGTLHLFVFSNVMHNNVHNILSARGLKSTTILVPAALRSNPETTTQSWNADVQTLLETTQSRRTFEGALRRHLIRANSDAGAARPSSVPTENQRITLFARLASWWHITSAALTFIATGLVIRRIEARSKLG